MHAPISSGMLVALEAAPDVQVTNEDIKRLHRERESFNVECYLEAQLGGDERWGCNDKLAELYLPRDMYEVKLVLEADPLRKHATLRRCGMMTSTELEGDHVVSGDLLLTPGTKAAVDDMKAFLEGPLAEARRQWAELKRRYAEELDKAVKDRDARHPRIRQFFSEEETKAARRFEEMNQHYRAEKAAKIAALAEIAQEAGIAAKRRDATA